MTPRYNLKLAFKNKSLLVSFFPDHFLIYPKVEGREKKTQLKTCSGSLPTSSGFACLTFSGLFLFIPASNTGSLERQDTKREKKESAGEGRRLRVPSGDEPSREGTEAVWGGLAGSRGSAGETRAGPAAPPLQDQPGAISLSLNFFFFFNSKLGTIPRWGKEEDGDSFKKINKKNKPKVSPINPEHAW